MDLLMVFRQDCLLAVRAVHWRWSMPQDERALLKVSLYFFRGATLSRAIYVRRWSYILAT